MRAMTERAEWDKLSSTLRELHRALIERARRDYEQENATVVQPAQFLQLLITDPAFAWLRPLSELMVDIDLVREAEPELRDEVSAAIRPVVEHLLSPRAGSGPPGGLGERYWKYVEDDPHVAMAHGGIRQAIRSWPRPQGDDAARTLHDRHRLAEKARHRRGR
jgi:hypothetical protein